MNIRQLLKAKNMTQSQLARRVGIDPTILSRYLTGKRSLRQPVVDRIMDALTTPDDMLPKNAIIDMVIAEVDKLGLIPEVAARVIIDLVKCCVVTGTYPTPSLAKKMALLTQ